MVVVLHHAIRNPARRRKEIVVCKLFIDGTRAMKVLIYS
jgi:hypothetical protein